MPSIPADPALRLLSEARVGVLVTSGPDGAPHAVPFVFAVAGTTLYWAVDAKPKRHPSLRRLENIRSNPAVTVLVHRYDEDWSRLWWVRGTGQARILDPAGAETTQALELLEARYEQYREERPPGPVVAVDLGELAGWRASSADPAV
jgi:PPOX class probable F420-dependent enzyme